MNHFIFGSIKICPYTFLCGGFVLLGLVVEKCLVVLEHAPDLVNLVTYIIIHVTANGLDGPLPDNYRPLFTIM